MPVAPSALHYFGVELTGRAVYNGDGLRVKKVVPGTGETTIFAYDASNRLVAEYSTVVEPAATAKTSYLTTDHLGSPRITTDQFGQVASRRDFMPYGEEIARQNYGADSIRQKFTGYERDNETALDFAEVRMYLAPLGRFSAPDPENAGAFQSEPQSWNGYIYVGNNPVNITDPTGLVWLRNGNDLYWMDDDAYARAKDTEYFIKNYGNYEVLEYGTVVTLADGQTGMFGGLDGQQVRLLRNQEFEPILPSGVEPVTVTWERSPFQQLADGSETVLWWGRPFVYALTIPIAAPAAVPGLTAGGGSAVGGAILGLGLRAAPSIPTGVAALNQLLNSVPRWERLTSKTQGFVQGNAQQIFDGIAQGGTTIAPNVVRMADGRVVTLYNSSTNGIATIQVAGPNVEKVVVRITQ